LSVFDKVPYAVREERGDIRSDVSPVLVEIFLAVVLVQTLEDAKLVASGGPGAIGDLVLGCRTLTS
jgi:hypothetical protein